MPSAISQMMCGLLDRIRGTQCRARLSQEPVSSARSVTDKDCRVLVREAAERSRWSCAREAMPWCGAWPVGFSPAADTLTSWGCCGGVNSSCCLDDLERSLGEAQPVARDRGDGDGGVGGAERHEQRGDVLGSRMRVPSSRRLTERRKRINVAAVECLGRPVVEFCRPAWRRSVKPEVAQEWQAMGEEAAAHDQHAFVSERTQGRPDPEQPARVE